MTWGAHPLRASLRLLASPYASRRGRATTRVAPTLYEPAASRCAAPPSIPPQRWGGSTAASRPLWIPAFAGMTCGCGPPPSPLLKEGGLPFELAAFYEVVEEVGVGF